MNALNNSVRFVHRKAKSRKISKYQETEIMIVSNDTNRIPEDKNDVERDVRKCAKKNMIKKRH